MKHDQMERMDSVREKENPILPTRHECARLPGLKSEERRMAAQHAAWTERLEAKQAEARRISAEPTSPDRDRRIEAINLEIEGINQKRMEVGNRQKDAFDEIRKLESVCKGIA